MTIREKAYMIWGYYRMRLNFYERNLLKKLLGGIQGLGDINDEQIKEYLTEGQVGWIKKLGLKFKIT